jgi:hypothetical protein
MSGRPVEDWSADEVDIVLTALQAEWAAAGFAAGFVAIAAFMRRQRRLGNATDGRWLARQVRDNALALMLPAPHDELRGALHGRLGSMLADPNKDVSAHAACVADVAECVGGQLAALIASLEARLQV